MPIQTNTLRIKDKLISPYEIEVSHNEYLVFRESKVSSGKNEGKIKRNVEGSFTSLASALKRIIRLRTVEKYQAENLTLEAYIKEFKETYQEIHLRLKTILE